MKTIGIIGGLSWQSTAMYYRLINEGVQQRLGGVASAKLLIYSFDFTEIDRALSDDTLDVIGNRLVQESIHLEKAGADGLVLAANTAHLWSTQVQNKLSIPLIHIADAVGKKIIADGLKRVLLLGTRYTMKGDFISSQLFKNYHIECLTPEEHDQKMIHHIIYNELVIGVFHDASRQKIIEIIQKQKGIQGVVLACTELPLLLKPDDVALPIYDTTMIHASAIVDFALSE